MGSNFCCDCKLRLSFKCKLKKQITKIIFFLIYHFFIQPRSRFILKVWKKAPTDLPRCRAFPTPMEDSIIGCCSMDLSVLVQRMTGISGWFNIVDYSGRVNGLLQIKCDALIDLNMFKMLKCQGNNLLNKSPTSMQASACPTSSLKTNETDTHFKQLESNLNLSHLNLGEAINQKFTELEVISKRLKEKLLCVTGDEEFPRNFDINSISQLEPTGDDDDDSHVLEFENDLNATVDSCSDDTENWLSDVKKYEEHLVLRPEVQKNTSERKDNL